MKLRPAQVVGLVAIVVFGGYLAARLLQGSRDPDLLPSGVRLSDHPTPSSPTPQLPPVELSTSTPVDPLAVGSDTAKDDLYCSGVIFAVHRSKPEHDLSEEAQARRNAVIALAEAGVTRLKIDGAATDATTASLADAHSEKAARDFEAGKTRISFEECMARAETPSAAN